MKFMPRLIVSMVSVVLLPTASFATCTSTLVATPNVASSNSELFGVGGSSASDVWAVGASSAQTLIEHFSGSTWSIVPSPNYPGSIVDGLTGVTADTTTDGWAVGMDDGKNLIEHWDGSAWSALPNHGLGGLSGVSSVPGDPSSVWAVGVHAQPNCRLPQGCATPVAIHWNVNKNRWDGTRVPSGHLGEGSLSAVVSLPGGSAWAAGEAERGSGFGQGPGPLIVHWTGSSWVLVNDAVFKGQLTSIAATSDTDVWVAGVEVEIGQIVNRFVEHWNGSTWTVYKFPLSQVATIASISEMSASDVWIVGYYTPVASPDVELPRLEHYDGVSWSVISSLADGLESEPSRLFQTAAGVWSVGTALPSFNYNKITFAELTHC
jgi:hypothetical protein